MLQKMKHLSTFLPPKLQIPAWRRVAQRTSFPFPPSPFCDQAVDETIQRIHWECSLWAPQRQQYLSKGPICLSFHVKPVAVFSAGPGHAPVAWNKSPANFDIKVNLSMERREFVVTVHVLTNSDRMHHIMLHHFRHASHHATPFHESMLHILPHHFTPACVTSCHTISFMTACIMSCYTMPCAS